MPSIFALNPVDADHLAEVVSAMRTLGAPTLRAVETAHGLVAIEGSHRLAAAEHLGLVPAIVIIEADEVVDGATLNDIAGDVWARCDCEGTSLRDFTVTGAELAAFCEGPAGTFHRFDA